jgi:MFS transporter, PAT family, beta-lactamase induction signal transducer AmpG
MPALAELDPQRPVHPFAYTILYVPYGMASGYVSVTLVYLLTQAGLSIEVVAGLVALQYLPQTWKVLWAPLIDTTLSTRQWYLISALLTGLAFLLMALVPPTRQFMWLFDVLVLVSSITSTFSSMATEMLMACNTPDNQRGRAGGWSQAGGLGGGGLGGGLALWMSQHAAAWSGGLLLALICPLCALALRYFKESERTPSSYRHYGQTLLGVGRDVWTIARTRIGFLALLLFVLPVGTAAASNLWPALAEDWHAGADTVALVNGALAGLIAMAGCLAGGYVCDLMDRKSAYALFGIAQALCAVAMALGSRTPAAFVLYTSIYAFLGGCLWAAFSAATLEAIGRSSAATKYNLMACFANVPITYMTVVDGHAQARFGSNGMLYTEAVLAAGAVMVFSAVVLSTRRRATPVAISAA